MRILVPKDSEFYDKNGAKLSSPNGFVRGCITSCGNGGPSNQVNVFPQLGVDPFLSDEILEEIDANELREAKKSPPLPDLPEFHAPSKFLDPEPFQVGNVVQVVGAGDDLFLILRINVETAEVASSDGKLSLRYLKDLR